MLPEAAIVDEVVEEADDSSDGEQVAFKEWLTSSESSLL